MSVDIIEAEIWSFQVAHQGYLPLGVDRPSLYQIASGARALGISNTAYCRDFTKEREIIAKQVLPDLGGRHDVLLLVYN